MQAHTQAADALRPFATVTVLLLLLLLLLLVSRPLIGLTLLGRIACIT